MYTFISHTGSKAAESFSPPTWGALRAFLPSRKGRVHINEVHDFNVIKGGKASLFLLY